MFIIGTKFLSKVIKMMKDYDQSVEINHDLNWPYIPDHPYRILIIGGSGSGKATQSAKRHLQDVLMMSFQDKQDILQMP